LVNHPDADLPLKTVAVMKNPLDSKRKEKTRWCSHYLLLGCRKRPIIDVLSIQRQSKVIYPPINKFSDQLSRKNTMEDDLFETG